MVRLLIFFLFALLLTACPRQEEATGETKLSLRADTAGSPAAGSPATAVPLLTKSISPHLVETPAGALPVWRQYRDQLPVLVLMANNPLLAPVPQELKTASLGLVQKGSAEEIARKGTALTADPLFLPQMTVRLALEAGLVSRMVWIFPSRTEPNQLDLDLFRRQLLEAGMLSAEEAKSLSMQDGCFTGTVAGRPFFACHPAQLPEISEPILLHIDVGYLQPLYKGEIKTSIYPLLGNILAGLREKSWPALAVSISAANLEGGVPVTSRFLSRDLAAIFEHPEYLGTTFPNLWEQRAQALYLENFFQKEKVREIYLGMEKAAPQDPSVKYALYGVARQFNEGDQALEYLRQAVDLDRVYALEYLTLADLAREKQLQKRVVEMLELANRALPENPFFTLHLAEALLQAGQKTDAEKLLQPISDLPWSPAFYPQIPGHLANLAKAR